MLASNKKQYADRIRALIEEGQSVAKLERPSSVGAYIKDSDNIKLQAWLMKVSNILESVFGPNSPQFRQYKEVIPKGGILFINDSVDIYPIVGVLSGALDDLESGFLLGQELLIAGEVFDSVLEQAKRLNESSYKDPAAILARVVLEDALKRIARRKGIDDRKKPSIINDELKKLGTFTQPQWRLIQVWIDIGNAAAHGKFGEYSQADVTKMIEGIEQFLATELRS